MTKRWRECRINAAYEIVEAGRNVERPDIDAFLEEVIAVCRKHGFALSYDDGFSEFMVVDADVSHEESLRSAIDNTSEDKS